MLPPCKSLLWHSVKKFRSLCKPCPPTQLNLCWPFFGFHRQENAWKCHRKAHIYIFLFLVLKRRRAGRQRQRDTCKIKLIIFQWRTKEVEIFTTKGLFGGKGGDGNKVASFLLVLPVLHREEQRSMMALQSGCLPF